jgi:hypothetical protein
MDIREYAKSSKISIKTLLWMEKIKIVSDPLIDNELIGLELIEKVWGRHDFICPQLRQKNITSDFLIRTSNSPNIRNSDLGNNRPKSSFLLDMYCWPFTNFNEQPFSRWRAAKIYQFAT